jgi:hypothetical protein
MRTVFPKTFAIVLTILFLIVPVQVVFEPVEYSVGASSSRADAFHDIKLYFHRGGSMDSIPPDQTPPSGANFLRNGDGLEFQLSPRLNSDLKVVSKGKVDNKDALFLVLDATFNTIGGTASITINIIDDSKTIATKTYQPTIETSYGVPFVDPVSEHTFGKDSIIKVNITAQTTGAGSVTITYDAQRSASFLYLTCNQIGALTLGAFHSDGSPGEFQPNAPDDRVIAFEGSVEDALGGYDINSVVLRCPSLSVFPSSVNAIVNDAGDKAVYYYNWTYPYGIPPAQYTVEATITDNSNNTFFHTATFTMAAFGVDLHIVEPEKSDEKGQSVSFDLQVTNTGGSSDSYLMTASPSLSWPTSFDPTAVTSVAPNMTRDVTLTVNIPVAAADNQQNIITITATSDSASTKKDSASAIATALATTDYTFVILGSSQKEIEESESATYSMKLTNVGDNADTYAVIISDDPSSGWQATLDGGTPVSSGSSYLRKEITLSASAQVTFTLTVWASGNPNSLTEEIVVTAFPKNDTSKYREVKTTTKLLTASEVRMMIDENARTKTSTVSEQEIVKPVPAYSSVQYTVNVENLGAEITLTFDVNLPSGTSGWKIDAPADITLDENDDKDVTFTITPSTGTAVNEGTGYGLTLKATSVDEPSVSTKATVYTKVMQYYKLEMSIEDNKIVSGSDKEVTYAITITNAGNGEDKVSVLVSSDWDIALSTTQTSEQIGIDTLIVTLPSGAQARVTLILTSPSDARNGDVDNALVTIRSSTFDTKNDYEYKQFPVKTIVEKQGSEAFMDSITDLWILFILVIAIIIIAVFLKIKIKDRQRD